MNKKYIFKQELIGFFIIVIVGSLMHFCFEWSGSFKPLALFCPVNESVWEHLKMGFWPALFYALYEYFAFGRETENFWPAKAIALYVIPITIVGVYYLVKAITGHHFLWLDIAIFILSIVLSQLLSYKIITSKKNYSLYKGLSLAMLIIIIAAFSLLTYFPPKLELFKDGNTGTYGISSI